MEQLIAPQKQLVFVYLPSRQTTVFERLKIHLPVPEFAKDFKFTVGKLFNWLLN